MGDVDDDAAVEDDALQEGDAVEEDGVVEDDDAVNGDAGCGLVAGAWGVVHGVVDAEARGAQWVDAMGLVGLNASEDDTAEVFVAVGAGRARQIRVRGVVVIPTMTRDVLYVQSGASACVPLGALALVVIHCVGSTNVEGSHAVTTQRYEVTHVYANFRHDVVMSYVGVNILSVGYAEHLALMMDHAFHAIAPGVVLSAIPRGVNAALSGVRKVPQGAGQSVRSAGRGEVSNVGSGATQDAKETSTVVGEHVMTRGPAREEEGVMRVRL